MPFASSQPPKSVRGGAPDLIIVNARIRTLEPASHPDAPVPTALAVKGNRILCLGPTDDLGRLAASHSRLIDARGALVLPIAGSTSPIEHAHLWDVPH